MVLEMQSSVPQTTTMEWALPEWLARHELPALVPGDDEGIMAIAADILDLQIENNTGGPFAAITWDLSTRQLVSVGVNVVVPQLNPTLHAENTATQLACKRLGVFQFGGKLGLATTGQMCGMCHTAAVWAGFGKILIGASAAVTEKYTGFDEGDLPQDWLERLEQRKIEVKTDLLSARVISAYERYKAAGGVIYNGTRG